MPLPRPLPEEMGEQNLSLLLRRAGPPLCREAEPRPGGLRGVTGAAAEVGGCTRPSGNESAAEMVTLENEEEPGTGFSCEQWGGYLRPAGWVGVWRVQGVVEGLWEGRKEGRGTHWLAEGLGLGGPHVQMGHHGLQPLALLGELQRGWRGWK